MCQISSLYRFDEPVNQRCSAKKIKRNKRFASCSNLQPWMLAMLLAFLLYPQNSLKGSALGDSTRKARQWGLHGTLGISTQFYRSGGSNARQRPFTYTFTGSPVITMFGRQVPVTMIVSEQDRRFVQPYNQIGLSPKGKWFTLHLGHRNIYFSNYTLAGTTLLGAGAELNPGKLRAGFMAGQLNRAVTNLDLIRNPSGLNVGGQLQYQRRAYCGKIGWGTDQRFVDLILFKGWDRQQSLDSNATDSLGVRPAENLAVGIAARLPLGKKIFWDLDAAVSGFTDDQRERNNTTGLAARIFPARNSSRVFTAARSSLSYFGSRIGLRLEYRRIDPDYQTMGMFFTQSDLRQITLSPSFGLFRHKVRVSGSIGVENDNLLKNREAGTQRLITNSSLFISPGKGKYGIDVAYSNFGISQTAGLRPLNDTIRISQTNTSISLNQRYGFKTDERFNSLFLTLMYQELTDLNIFTSASQQNASRIGMLSYNSNPMKKGPGYTVSLTASDFAQNNLAYSLAGGSFTGNYRWKQGAFMLQSMLSYQASFNAGNSSGGVVNFSIGGMASPGKSHQLSVRGNILNSRNRAIAQLNYSEQLVQFDYRFKF